MSNEERELKEYKVDVKGGEKKPIVDLFVMKVRGHYIPYFRREGESQFQMAQEAVPKAVYEARQAKKAKKANPKLKALALVLFVALVYASFVL